MGEGMARRPVLRLARAGDGGGLNFLPAGVLSSYAPNSTTLNPRNGTHNGGTYSSCCACDYCWRVNWSGYV